MATVGCSPCWVVRSRSGSPLLCLQQQSTAPTSAGVISAANQAPKSQTGLLNLSRFSPQLFKDAWLLHMHANPWTWQPLKVENEDHGAPELWCHPACRVRTRWTLRSLLYIP